MRKGIDMKKFLVVLGLIMSLLSSCSRVEPNYVGVLMENYGKNGKSDFSLQRGAVWVFWFGQKLFTVPLWEQRADFETDLNLNASDNTAFTTKPIYSFKVIESKAVDVVFDNKQLGYGSDFIKSLQDNVLEPRIYDMMKEESRKYTTNELMENGGSLKFEQTLQQQLKVEFEKRGLELLTFSSQLKFSETVTKKIDKRNEVDTNISVIERQIQEQLKRNELEELKTKQNLIRSQGITPQLLQEQFISKWDGKTPLYGNLPITLMKKE